jgi:Cu(I)/Ag(I) efflux system membrane protein CusA/SilA
VPGVAEVASVGGFQKQYQVTVDPNRLRAYGVTLTEVIEAIRQSNNDVGGRIIEFSGREYYVRGRGYIQDLGAIEKIALRTSGPGGTPLLVRDVASVRFGPDIRRGLLEWNGEGEAVGAIVMMRYGENALDVIGRVKKKFEDLKPSFPEGVEMTIAYDRSGLIERSVETLKHALPRGGHHREPGDHPVPPPPAQLDASHPLAAHQRGAVLHPHVLPGHPVDHHEPRAGSPSPSAPRSMPRS